MKERMRPRTSGVYTEADDALLVRVSLVLAFPRHVQGLLAADVERYYEAAFRFILWAG